MLWGRTGALATLLGASLLLWCGESFAQQPPADPTGDVERVEGDEAPPPVSDDAPPSAGDDAQPTEAPKLPKPPPAYRVPPPPPGARYPGMEDIGPGSHATADAGELRLPLSISTRLRVLSTDLEALSSRGDSSTANGLLSVVTGGLSVALGYLQEDDAFSSFLYVFGVATMLRGGVDMVVTPDPTEPALEFGHMPMRDLDEVRARLEFGEAGLMGLADDYRLARILDGSLSLASGVTIIPLVLLPNGFAFDGPLDVFVVVGAGISAISGIISLVTPSEAERRRDAYGQLKTKLASPPGASRKVELDVSARPDGAQLRLHGRF